MESEAPKTYKGVVMCPRCGTYVMADEPIDPCGEWWWGTRKDEDCWHYLTCMQPACGAPELVKGVDTLAGGSGGHPRGIGTRCAACEDDRVGTWREWLCSPDEDEST